MNDSDDTFELDYLLRRLQYRISVIKILGLIIIGGTIVNLFVSVWTIPQMRLGGPIASSSSFIRIEPLLFTSAGVTLLVILLSLYFEQARRSGDTIFEVISDELHRPNENLEDETLDQKRVLSIRARFLLRDFARNSELPLVPGKFGPAFLCLVNIVITVTNLSLCIQLHS